MRAFAQRFFLSVLLVTLLTGWGLAQSSAGQDMKDAGNSTKAAGQDVGSATKKTAKKTGHAAKKGTHKAAHKTKQGASKVEQNTPPQ